MAFYTDNCEVLIAGMLELGFETMLPDELHAPIIITFHMPGGPRFDFGIFDDNLAALRFLIYPGNLTVAESFRIGCIGRLYADQMRAALGAIRTTLTDMGVPQCARQIDH